MAEPPPLGFACAAAKPPASRSTEKRPAKAIKRDKTPVVARGSPTRNALRGRVSPSSAMSSLQSVLSYA